MKILQLVSIAYMFILAGCYAIKPSEPELEMLTHDVLKNKEGIQIQILPMDKPKVVPSK
jgi:hypothetical protein